jgi:hypothetical protein
MDKAMLELIKERTALKRQVPLANGTKSGRHKKVAGPNHIADEGRWSYREERRQVPRGPRCMARADCVVRSSC